MKEFIMSSEILWYIWIVGKAYLQVGLLSALILLIVTFDNSEMNRVTLKELIFTKAIVNSCVFTLGPSM
jgi:hypothetical protein